MSINGLLAAPFLGLTRTHVGASSQGIAPVGAIGGRPVRGQNRHCGHSCERENKARASIVPISILAGHGVALFERSEFAARPEHDLLPHFIEWMVARTTHPDHRVFQHDRYEAK
jgi:hypothetical protein